MAFALSDYEITGTIGAGCFGTVYRARQKSLGRTVAIKCLSPHLMQNRDELRRFRREAQAMASLSHDNIIAVYDYGYASGSYYIVMEFVDGVSFETALAGGIPTDLSLYILDKIAGALRCAHGKNIIHRDMKPANIFLGRNGQVRLADFGLALIERQMTSQSSVHAIGTLAYMAPEVMVSPGAIDSRADIYSFGCLLYESLAGRLPFDGITMAEISYKVLNQEPAPLGLGRDRGELEAVTLRCLCKEREGRPGLDEIETCLRGVLREHYDSLPGRLAAFVRNGPGAAPAAPVTAAPPASAAARPRRAMAVRVSFAALAAVIVAATGIFFAQRRPRPALLPPLPPEQAISDPGGAANARVPVPGRGPMPLAGENGTRAGSLVIRGVTPVDSLFVNGQHMDSLTAPEQVLRVKSGHYRLRLKRPGGRVVTKEIEIVPYQVIEWQVGKQDGASR